MRILLGVCGSISAYKSYDLARSLIKEGHNLRVVLTKGALKFVTPEVFRYLGVEQVYHDHDDFTYPRALGDAPVLHVDLAKWCERLIVAPLSANTLSDFAMARAEGLLPTTFLALPKEKPVMLFPAMNTQMLHHPFVEENMDILSRFERHPNCYLAPTDSGLLACGDFGEGKLMDVEQMSKIIHWFRPKKNHEQKRVLVATGATKSYLDPVRYLTNPSSGLTGILIAAEFLRKGDRVELVAPKDCIQNYPWIEKLPDVTIFPAESTEDFNRIVKERLPKCTHYYSPAALGDFNFAPQDDKIKKEQMSLTLTLTRSQDVLENVLQWRKPEQKIIGFAAETDLGQNIIAEKLKRKPVDILVATQVHAGNSSKKLQGFKNDQAYYKIYVRQSLFHEGIMTKKQLAELLAGELS